MVTDTEMLGESGSSKRVSSPIFEIWGVT